MYVFAGIHKEINGLEPNGLVVPPHLSSTSTSTGGSEEKSDTLSHSDSAQHQSPESSSGASSLGVGTRCTRWEEQ